jgi:hypothetical protein
MATGTKEMADRFRRTMTRRAWIPLVAVALAGLFYVAFLRENDEDRIRRRLTELSKAVRIDVSEGDNGAARALRIRNTFARVFSSGVRFQIPNLSASSLEDLAELAIGAGASFRSAELRFDRVRVQVAPGARSASVDTDATLTTTGLEGGSSKETRKLDLRFQNLDGDWRIAAVLPGDSG